MFQLIEQGVTFKMNSDDTPSKLTEVLQVPSKTRSSKK